MTNEFIKIKNKYGQSIFVNPKDPLNKKIIENGIYDSTGLYFIEKILAALPRESVFDVGANIGNHSLRMGLYTKGVYLFEPNPILKEVLLKTCFENSATMNWHIFPLALSNKTGMFNFYQNQESNMQSSLVQGVTNHKCEEIEVHTIIGDSVVEYLKIQHDSFNLNFIKIDVEGHDPEVVLGLKNTIKEYRPIVFIEWDNQRAKNLFIEKSKEFDDIFNLYIRKPIVRNNKSIIKKLLTLDWKNKILGDFNPEKNYRHLVFIPYEKIELMKEIGIL